MKSLILMSALLTALVGCNDTDLEEETFEVGDLDSYSTEVQTYVGYRCGSLDCHGDMGRMLRIYAERGLRSQDALRDQELSASELEQNLLSFSVFDGRGAAVEKHQVLLKALAVSAGGMAHEGGAVWPNTDAPGYRCLQAWLAGSSSSEGAQVACAEATAGVVPDDSD